jgi:hypothetical protein
MFTAPWLITQLWSLYVFQKVTVPSAYTDDTDDYDDGGLSGKLSAS